MVRMKGFVVVGVVVFGGILGRGVFDVVLGK